MNDKAIKEWVKQDDIVKDACSRVCRGKYGIATHNVEDVIDRTIELTIDFTLREVNAEKENIRQKLIESLKQYEKENIDTVRQSRLFAVMLNDIVEIINRCFGGKND